eukprot:11938548-Alexandrium_andersonii.AAC.1
MPPRKQPFRVSRGETVAHPADGLQPGAKGVTGRAGARGGDDVSQLRSDASVGPACAAPAPPPSLGDREEEAVTPAGHGWRTRDGRCARR